jgi:hypothetical protein
MAEDQPTPTIEHTEPFSPMDVVPNSDAGIQQYSPMDTLASDAGLEPQFSPMDTVRSEAHMEYSRSSPMNDVTHETDFGHQGYSPMNTMNSDVDQRQERFSPTDSFAGSNARASPIDLVGGADSEDDSFGNSEISIADLGDPTQPIAQNIENPRREYGRTSLETPVIGATEHHFLDDENIHSTPSKMPSPTRERAIQSSRSSHNTASPQSGTYPTPTPTSSLADEETQVEQNSVDQYTGSNLEHTETDPVEDSAEEPEEYEEYDTIMESEGFTMISLDTLPSAKQHGFGSSALTNDSSKPKEVGDRLKRKLPGTIEDLRSDSRARKSSSPLSTGLVPGSHGKNKPRLSDSPARIPTSQHAVNHVNEITYPELPAAVSPAKAAVAPKKRKFTSLAKLVRVALALQGPFRPQVHEWSGHNNVRHKRQRLEGLFDTFDAETQHKLRVAMALGQEIATRRMITEEEAAAAVAAERSAAHLEEQQEQPNDDEFASQSDELERDRYLEDEAEQDPSFANKAVEHEETIQSPHFRPNNSMQQSPLSHQKRQREAEWQLEREAVNRQAQMASGSNSAVYIESDDIATEDEEVDEPEAGLSYNDRPQSEPETVPETAPYQEPEADFQSEPAEDEDDGYDDIWQLEANDHSNVQHSDDDIQSEPMQPPTPLGNLSPAPAGREQPTSSPYALSEHDLVARLGPGKVRELREQKVDLSALLAEEDTPNRARYYNGTSTPRSVLSRPSGTQHSPLNSVMKQPVSRTPAHVRLQPLSQSSPEVASPQLSFHEWENSPQVMHQGSNEELPLEDDHAGGSIPLGSAPLHSTSTPGPRQLTRETPGSSWFSKITSFTPQWLKAPTRARSSSVTTIPEEQSESEEEDLADIESAKELSEHLYDEPISKQASQSPASHWNQHSQSPQTRQDVYPTMEEEDPIDASSSSRHISEEHEEAVFEGNDSPGLSENEETEPIADQNEASSGPRPLAAFGYFSDEHYVALRRIYRIAKRYPEQFEYYDTPGRASIIGDWIWTSDGHHGVPITEIQFAIIDRFAQELSRADIQYGGSGQIDWTEADLHRRLISIIIGEQIRDERKAKANRGTSVDTWR